MTEPGLSPAARRFVDYFGELGPRWGLPAQACRVHAFFFIAAKPVSERDVALALSLHTDTLNDALAFLADYQMAERVGDSCWRTSTDPWEMMVSGLEQRGRRELPLALETMRTCGEDARQDSNVSRTATLQIGKMLALVEDLAAIDAQAGRLPSRTMRGLIGASGRAARFMDRTFSKRRRRR
jgi:DNA-binding transcriptional regulator GbsR (MarR family)